MNGFDIDAIIVPCVFAFAAWILYLFFRRYQVSAQMRMKRVESFDRMIEKFQSAKEFSEFAQSLEGKRLLNDPIAPPANPLNKVLRFVQAGSLLLMLGLGSWINGWRLRSETDINYMRQSIESYHWGTLLFFIGVGCLGAACLSYYFVRL